MFQEEREDIEDDAEESCPSASYRDQGIHDLVPLIDYTG